MSLQLTCKKQNCTNPTIPRGKYCNEHRTNKRRCLTSGCPSSAQGKTDHCVAHGGGKRCLTSGCPSSAQGKTDHCKVHGGGKRCITSACPSSAEGKTDHCKVHGGGKRCLTSGCPSSAQGKSDHCVAHGGGKRCLTQYCPSSAQDKSDHCVAHGGGRRCLTQYCPSSAQDKSDHCIAHGGGRRCPNCIDWIDSRCGQSKYDGYCATCFKRVFPLDPRSLVVYEHTMEILVRNAIIQSGEITPLFKKFIHDRPLYTGNCDCTHRRRIDHRLLLGNTIIAVETDEFCHRSYDARDEEIRYDDLYMLHSGKWIFIRFNPNNTKTQKTDLDDRLTILLQVIERQIERVMADENTELIEIIKLFYI